MHIFVGVVIVPMLFIALLYHWLLADWFARVLVFLMVCVVFFLLDCIMFAAPDGKVVAIVLLPILGCVAWGIASIPIHLHKKRSYQAMGAEWRTAWEQARAAEGHAHRGHRKSY